MATRLLVTADPVHQGELEPRTPDAGGREATKRRARTDACEPSSTRTAFNLPSSSSPSSSSSPAHTDELHHTVTTPSRSEHGSVSDATVAPATARQFLWTRAKRVTGAERSTIASSALASGRGPRRLEGPPRRSPRDTGSMGVDTSLGDGHRIVCPGYVLGLRRRDDGLARGLHELDEPLPPLTVKLRHHIIQQQQG
jgi:hypothetical protein